MMTITNEIGFIVPTIIALCHTDPINILNMVTTNNLIIYLEEFIKYKIINKKFIITDNDAIVCSLLCIKLGLDNIQNNYQFIFDIFNVNKIEIDNNKIINMITLHVNTNKQTTIKKLLNEWQTNENINIINIPQFICLNIIRDKDIQIDIQKKIKLNTINNWNFYSALCKHNNEYYVLLHKDDDYYIYDPNINQQFYTIKMDNKEIADKIKQECIFIVYKLVD